MNKEYLLTNIAEGCKAMASVSRFVFKGEMTAPNSAISETRKLKGENRLAVVRFGRLGIRLLRDPRIAALIFDEGKEEVTLVEGYNLRSPWSPEVKLIGRDVPQLRLFIDGGGSINPSQVKPETINETFERWTEQAAVALAPARNSNAWKFDLAKGERAMYVHGPRRGEPYIGYTMRGSRRFEAEDIARSTAWLEAYAKGSRDLFSRAQRSIDRLTIVEDEGLQLLRITEACEQAAKLIQESLGR